MDTLGGGGELIRGQSLKSPNGRFELKMQQDGNVVLYDQSRPIWATNTQKDGAERLAMQDDGDFVVYAKRTPVWSSKTPGHQGASLKLQDDGNLVVHPGASSARPLWASNTYTSGTASGAKPRDRRVYTVAKGDSLWRIAEKLYGQGTDFVKIVSANNITDPDHIRPGQQLVIPE